MKLFTCLSSMLTILLATSVAQAHFPFLKMERKAGASSQLQLFFSDSLEPEGEAMLKYVEPMQVMHIPSRGEVKPIDLKVQANIKSCDINANEQDDLFVVQHELGVRTKENQSYLVRYYAETGPSLSGMSWRTLKKQTIQDLKVIPSIQAGQLKTEVLFQGKPVDQAEVTYYVESGEIPAAKTNAAGVVEAALEGKSVVGVRVKFIEGKAGEIEGKAYTEIRHYTTVTFPMATWKSLNLSEGLPDIPETVTSFGATYDQGIAYYYGGHTGDAHSYDSEGQSKSLWALNLQTTAKWEKLSDGPGLQGLALVADQGKLYRIGGFTAKNKVDEEKDLWSQANVSRFDLATKTWTEIVPLPEPRSSFDAVVYDHKIYVLGGWSMQGNKESEWHKTGWVLDLTKADLKWEALPEPPFQKRALSVAAHRGKIYAIGGMLASGNITTEVSVYDINTQKWSAGPAVIGGGMTGFGTASYEHEGQLYCSTYDGTLQQLSADGTSWKLVGNFKDARFFHRMLPAGKSKLLILGGSSMSIGKFSNLEIVNLPSTP